MSPQPRFLTLILAVLMAIILYTFRRTLSCSAGGMNTTNSSSTFVKGYNSSYSSSSYSSSSYSSSSYNSSSSSYYQTEKNTLSVSDLPGYTGWARPSATLSGHFTIQPQQQPQPPLAIVVNQDWSLILTCHECHRAAHTTHPQYYAPHHPWFYVRAYGPTIVTGTVRPMASSQQQQQQDYQVTLHPTVAGRYWLEVVVTYSHPIEPQYFPLSLLVMSSSSSSLLLSPDQPTPPVPSYEGYVLPGFPLPFTVVNVDDAVQTWADPNTLDARDASQRSYYCTTKELTIRDRTNDDENDSDNDEDDDGSYLWKPWSWRVTSMTTNRNHQPPYHNSNNSNVTLRGYQWGYNSLGFRAAYEHRDCRLHEHLSDTAAAVCEDPQPQPKLRHIIFIGDSVMRLQKNYWEEHYLLKNNDSVNATVTFVELFGGALRCSRLSGPFVRDLIHKDATTTQQHHPTDIERRTVILFNTGMHDVHRLCGATFESDRATYLTAQELRGSSCLDVYRTAVRELVTTVQQIPATVRLFQTTTAAWPKHGNYGVAWDPRYPQELPLDAAFVERFNRVAVQEIQSINAASAADQQIVMVDAYWMTLARPDNRETNKVADIGKKLSHPGYEVTQYMVRMWWQVAMQLLCRA